MTYKYTRNILLAPLTANNSLILFFTSVTTRNIFIYIAHRLIYAHITRVLHDNTNANNQEPCTP
jgi:hypothetical protein